MKRTFRTLLLAIPLVFALSACSDDSPGGGDGGEKGDATIRSLDLKSASYLTLGTGLSRSGDNADLLKIDENGNVSTVKTVIIRDADGNDVEEQHEIQVRPYKIADLGEYLVLYDCIFFDMTAGYPVDMPAYDKMNTSKGSPKHFLVRKKDGRVFFIPDTEHKYIRDEADRLNAYGVDRNGTLLLCTPDSGTGLTRAEFSGDIVRFTPLSDVSQVTVDGRTDVVYGNNIWVLTDNTIILNEGMGSEQNYIYYPDGSFERFGTDRADNSDIDHKMVGLSFTAGNLYAVRHVSKAPSNDSPCKITVSLHKVTLGNTAGNISVSEPLSEITGKRGFTEELGDLPWLNKTVHTLWAYESSNNFIVAGSLVLDKSSLEFTPVPWEMYWEIFMLEPDADSIYKGRIWRVDSQGASWLNPATLDYGRITYNTGVAAQAESCTATDIPQGKAAFIIYSENGTSYPLLIKNIETGDFVKGSPLTTSSSGVLLGL